MPICEAFHRLLGCAPQPCSLCNCPATRPKKKPGVSGRDISDLLDRDSYKSEAKVLEQHPTIYGQRQAGQSSNLRCTGEEEATVIGGMTSEGLLCCQGTAGTRPPQLFGFPTIGTAAVSC